MVSGHYALADSFATWGYGMKSVVLSVIAASALLLVGACGTHPHTAAKSAASTPARGTTPATTPAEAGPSVVLTDENGFKFRISDAKTGMAPQIQDKSAPPGSMIPWVTFTVTNLQTDRSASASTLMETVYLETPQDVSKWESPYDCSESGSQKWCSGQDTCELPGTTDEVTNMPVILDYTTIPMPPGHAWTVRCFSDMLVKDSADPAAFRFFQSRENYMGNEGHDTVVPTT